MPDKAKTPIRTINVTEFRARFSKLIDDVTASGDEIIITKRGKPIARLIPFRARPESLFGIDKGNMRILGDIVEPLDVEWEALQGSSHIDSS